MTTGYLCLSTEEKSRIVKEMLDFLRGFWGRKNSKGGWNILYVKEESDVENKNFKLEKDDFLYEVFYRDGNWNVEDRGCNFCRGINPNPEGEMFSFDPSSGFFL